MISVKETEEDLYLSKQNNNMKVITKEYITKHAKITKLIDDNQDHLKEIQEKYLIELDNVKRSIKRLQDECEHPDSIFFGDSSGNNDSYHRCTICGYEW